MDSDDDDHVPLSWKAENLGAMSVQNERKVLQLIHQVCTAALKQYPTSLQEDIAILAKDDIEHNLSFNLRNCVLFRQGEKEVLHYYIEFSDYMSSLLGMKFREAKKETQQLPKQFESARDYIHQSIMPLLLVVN